MSGQHMKQRLLSASCAGLLLGAAAPAWSPVAWGQGSSTGPQVEQGGPRSMDRSLPGKRRGVLTSAKKGTVWIDRTPYTFAADAVIVNRTGRPLLVQELKWDDINYPVDYWLAADSADRQIVQLIIYFPE